MHGILAVLPFPADVVNEMLQPVLSNCNIGLNLYEETTAAVIFLLDVMSLDADTSLQALTGMRTVVVSCRM